MPSIFKQRQIIDRAKIIGDVDSLMSAGQSPKEIRQDFDALSSQPLLNLIKGHSKDLCIRFDESTRRDLNLLLDLSNRQMTSSLMLEACLFRRECRGGHFRTDVPLAVPYWEGHSRQQLGKTISTRPVKL